MHHLRAHAEPPYTAVQELQFQEQLAMLVSLKWQLRKRTRHQPFDYEALLRRSGWDDASALIAFIEEEKGLACKLMKVR